MLFALGACHSATAPIPSAGTVDGALAPVETAPGAGNVNGVDAEAARVPAEDAGTPPLAMKSGDEGDASAPKEGPEGMLLVPGGKFTMGSDTIGEGDERPAHEVTLAPFYLDRTEVTQASYDECVAAKACTPPDGAILATFGGLFRGPNKPVVGVSWFDAQKYCAWRGKRLPREAEFERAVRGDDGRKFPWGNDAPTHERTVFETNATEEVASHPTGRGPYGHDDLAGNVWEWMADDYDPFAYRRATASEGRPGTCEEIIAAQNELRKAGKQGFTGSNPIPNECEKNIRGGAYNYSGGGLRSTNRIHHPPRFKLRMTGLRCAKDV
ncbi:hypothetical protein AKJ09_01059 [Labilithrix luteola]|uniref:Sulfatase-modifying factor enzyme-like domain-containing protein n=1 Tax=Labilithrix luteola TaxID=1391654 RepID=A0A0K1PLJ4_9BACT|nr:formylglycine-generating enzyme family protein [Labilithrix luteola]AKU94395.1 hypothetical protein AKJ09_01059 [Labilithrix luteola]